MISRNMICAVAALAISALPSRAIVAQAPDTTRRDSTFDVRSLFGEHEDRSSLTITSGKTYNRIEGFPILIGPTFRDNVGGASVHLAVLGLIRTAHSAHWYSDNLGHRVTAEVRFGGRKGYAIGASSFDVVFSRSTTTSTGSAATAGDCTHQHSPETWRRSKWNMDTSVGAHAVRVTSRRCFAVLETGESIRRWMMERCTSSRRISRSTHVMPF